MSTCLWSGAWPEVFKAHRRPYLPEDPRRAHPALRFERTLAFTHVTDDLALAAQTATGWQTYLSRLEPHLAGSHLPEEEAHKLWADIHERYAEQFGVDPTPGRRFAETLRAGQ